MPEQIPFVAFDAASATPLECLGWATKSIVAGAFVESVQSDIPAAWRAGARIVDGVTNYFTGGPLAAGETLPTIEEMTTAMAALGAAVGVPVPAGAEGSAFPWMQILITFMELLIKLRQNSEA